MICPKCNTENPNGSLMCNSCGSLLNQIETPEQKEEIEEVETLEVENEVVPKEIPKPHVKRQFFFGIKNNNSELNSSPIMQQLEQEYTERPKIEFEDDIMNQPVNNYVLNEKNKKLAIKEIKVDKKIGYIATGILAFIALIISILLLKGLNNIPLYNNAVRSINEYLKSDSLSSLSVIGIYILLVLYMAYDSYKSKTATVRSTSTKAVLISIILSLLSIFFIEGFNTISESTTIVNLVIRFLLFTIILFVNRFFRQLYNKLQVKGDCNNFLFEILIYFDIIGIITLIFA